MIEIRDIKKIYRMGDQEVAALNGVDLTIQAGEFVAIMGPSGSGKSTLMHILGLLDTPDSGSYRLLGNEVATLSEDELAIMRRGVIGFVFQQFNLLSRTTALENVALPQLYSERSFNFRKATGHLQAVGLGDRTDHKPNELSGGQQQRVAIARSLINDPKIILADEPTGNLDSKSEKEIMAILTELNAQGITIIVVTHEEQIAAHANRVVRMRDGRVQSDETKTKWVPSESIVVAKPPQKKESALSILRSEFFSHVREGIKALLSNKVRSILSMLGILIGVAAVIAMLALGRGARESIEKQLASLGSNLLVLRAGAFRVVGVSLDSGSVTRLTTNDAEAVAADPAVKRVSCLVQGRGQAVYRDKNWSTQILGSDHHYAAMRAILPQIGRYFDNDENRRRMRVAVIGMTVVNHLFGEADPIGEMIKINQVPFQVIGVLPEKGSNGFRDQDDQIIIPLETAKRRLLGKDYLDEIDIEIASADQIDEAQERIEALMLKRHPVIGSQPEPFQIRNLADIQAAFTESSRTMSWLLAAIAAISLLVGGIGIMNIMLVSVTERTREIGLRKAIGARRRDILSQFLIEAIVVSVAGGALGILLGSTITLLLSTLAGWTATISLDSVILASVFSTSIGVIFGIWPARKASLLSPIQALRYE